MKKFRKLKFVFHMDRPIVYPKCSQKMPKVKFISGRESYVNVNLNFLLKCIYLVQEPPSLQSGVGFSTSSVDLIFGKSNPILEVNFVLQSGCSGIRQHLHSIESKSSSQVGQGSGAPEHPKVSLIGKQAKERITKIQQYFIMLILHNQSVPCLQ